MTFEFFGSVEPDQVLTLGDEIVEKFQHRSDMECLDYDALAEYEAIKASNAEPDVAPPAAPEVAVAVTPPPPPTVSAKPKNDAAPAATQE